MTSPNYKAKLAAMTIRAEAAEGKCRELATEVSRLQGTISILTKRSDHLRSELVDSRNDIEYIKREVGAHPAYAHIERAGVKP